MARSDFLQKIDASFRWPNQVSKTAISAALKKLRQPLGGIY